MKNYACSDCALFGLCGGGCTSEALATNGIATTPAEQNCKVKKFFYKALLQEYAFDPDRPLFAYYERINKRGKCNTKTDNAQ